VTASERAIELSLAAAQAAADKLATDVVILDVSEQLVITDAVIIAPQRAAGAVGRRRGGGAAARAGG